MDGKANSGIAGIALRSAFLMLGLAFPGSMVCGGEKIAPVNDLPNPYKRITGHFKLPAGRTWGSTSAVDIDPDGRFIWVAERCGANRCMDSDLPVVLKFNARGKLVKSFGAGIFIFPHGIHVDGDGNVWVTDADGPDGKDPNREGKGHQVIKFSPDGEALLRLGKPGIAGDGTGPLLKAPCDVITAPDGSIFVADGHLGQYADPFSNEVSRIVKFDREGNYLMHWGRLGSGPGEFRTPHGLAMDSRGRLFVADRGNDRIQIFDQEGHFLEEWHQFSRLSGIFIDANDRLYGTDSESSDADRLYHPGWKRGIRIGSAKTGEVEFLIPDPAAEWKGTTGAEGVAADRKGNVYGAEVGSRQLVKYVRR